MVRMRRINVGDAFELRYKHRAYFQHMNFALRFQRMVRKHTRATSINVVRGGYVVKWM